MKGVMKAARPAVKAMKAMKAMKAIKLMKAMKAKKSKIASGKYRYNLVMWGRRTKTGGGLTKEDLMTGGKGKIVSRRKWELGKKRYGQISVWVECTKQARKELGLTGFVLLNKDGELYKRSREHFDATKKEQGVASSAPAVESEAPLTRRLSSNTFS